MSPAPPTSILLPVRDAASTLPAALASLAVQTDPDYELLLVDDGSRDGSAELLRSHAAADPRARLLRTAPAGRGLVPALELGRRAARGRYVLRMDADDLAHPRRLELSRAWLEADPRLGAVGTLVRSFPVAQLPPGRRLYDAWLNGLRDHEAMARERFVESPLAHPSVLFRARAVEAVGGYRAGPWPEDYDLWLRLLQAGWRLGKVPRPLLFWREDPHRTSRTDPRYSADAFARARAQALAAHLVGRAAGIVGAGQEGKRLARALRATGVELRFFLDLDPRKAGRAPGGVPVLDPAEGLRRRGDAVLLTSVRGRGRRAAARSWLREAGLREGEDFYLAG